MKLKTEMDRRSSGFMGRRNSNKKNNSGGGENTDKTPGYEEV